MSKLILRGHRGAEFRLSVVQFRSPMSAQITTVQTRTMSQHFPVRAGQPDIQFTVQFRSIAEHHEFRDFVRDHQRSSQQYDYSVDTDKSGMVTLFWPQRGIVNWTGYITTMPGREVRFEYAPRVTFGVSLVDSMLSQRTMQSSSGNDVFTIVGMEIGRYIPYVIEDLLQRPTMPSSQTQDNTNPDQATQDSQQPNVLSSVVDWIGGIFS